MENLEFLSVVLWKAGKLRLSFETYLSVRLQWDLWQINTPLLNIKFWGHFEKKNLFIYMFWKNQCLFLETCPLVLWNNPFTFNLRSLETNFGANYGVIIAVQQLRKIIRHFAKYFTYQKQHEIYVEYYGAIFWRHNLPIQITLLSYIFCVEIFFWKIAGYPLTHTYIHKKYFASTQTHRNITK